jgi:hypothetical protein
MEISSHSEVKTLLVVYKKNNLFRLYREYDAVCFEHHTKHMKAFYGKKRIIPNVKGFSRLHKVTAKF